MEFEYTSKEDLYYNFVLFKYIPINSTEGKYTNTNIFYKAIENSSNKQKFLNIILKLRKLLGKNQVVWGIKQINEKLIYELYFYQIYNPKLVSIKNIINELKEDFNIFNFEEINNLNSVMFSFDFLENQFKINKLDIYFNRYIGNNLHTKAFSIGENYATEFKNYYITYNPLELNEIKISILNSPYKITKEQLNEILIPELMKCNKIYVGSKRNCNGIYYQGLNIEQFLFFLKKINFNLNIIEFIEKNKDKFNYLLFDVSFDYDIIENKLVILKSGFYGTF